MSSDAYERRPVDPNNEIALAETCPFGPRGGMYFRDVDADVALGNLRVVFMAGCEGPILLDAQKAECGVYVVVEVG